MIGRRSRLVLPGGAALDARPRIGQRLLVGALGDRDALEPDVQPRVVHHREHVFEAAVFLADQIAGRPASSP